MTEIKKLKINFFQLFFRYKTIYCNLYSLNLKCNYIFDIFNALLLLKNA